MGDFEHRDTLASTAVTLKHTQSETGLRQIAFKAEDASWRPFQRFLLIGRVHNVNTRCEDHRNDIWQLN
jgi:hypothetical protein